MQFSPSIFKAYDIRGVVPATVNEAMAEALGLAFGTIARGEGETSVAVGRDGRLSGPSLSAALVRGLVASGVDVIDIGPVTTPMLYFAASTLCSSGIQVTGSHNPKDYNGFKMVLAGPGHLRRGDPGAAPADGDRAPRPPPSPGSVRNVNLLEPYRDRILQDVKLARPLKLVVDSGNGIAGASAPGIFRALGCEVIELFSEVDGTFPNHHPDPSKPENLKDLIAAIGRHGADLGLAFDGDGDRLGIITRGGNNIYPDRQMMLFARDVLTPRARRHHPVRRQVHAAPGARHPRSRRRAADVQDRALADQGEDEGSRFAAGRRDERPHLLQGALVRLRRRHVCRRAPAGDPVAPRGSERRAGRPAHQFLHARTQCEVRRGRAARPGEAADRPAPTSPRRRRSRPSTACGWTGPTASA